MSISFEQLISGVTHSQYSLKPKARLQVAPQPTPFVAPALKVLDDVEHCIEVEVIFITAPAAVGKSTLAKAMSSRTRAPILDLAKVPVSTQSLVGMLHADFEGISNPVDAFLRGELPVIVDALDEGRLLSGEQSFEKFLETTGELLDSVRKVTRKPKLIFLGRNESIELTKLGLQMGGQEFTYASIEVDFFEEPAARQLIDAYALAIATPDSAYIQHPGPRRQLIDAYFSAIASSLGLSNAELWEKEEGRAFAGYAPVLAALGDLLAKFDNFVDVLNDLRARGSQHAWTVIERVLKAILEREQKQLVKLLASHVTVSLPPEVYDPQEQLTLLARVIHGYTQTPSARVKLPQQAMVAYEAMVDQKLAEHPFIRLGKPANSVLGSLIVSHAIYYDLMRLGDNTYLAPLSRQPFIWRSLSELLQADNSLLDGRYIGYALNSLWNDPMRDLGLTRIRDAEERAVAVAVIPLKERKVLTTQLTLPLWLYAQARDCTVNVSGPVKLFGEGLGAPGGFFLFRGDTELICESLETDADAISFEGKTWLEANDLNAKQRIDLRLVKDAQVGFAGTVSEAFPWNRLPQSLRRPHGGTNMSALESLLEECSRRLPEGAAITLRPDLSNPDDGRLRWVDQRFKREFATLVGLMVTHKVAVVDQLSAKGETKVHIRFNIAWRELFDEVVAGQPNSINSALIADLRREFAKF